MKVCFRKAVHLTQMELRRINPCQYEELNYCSKNADCLPDTSKAGGFRCVCREKYTDNSPDDDYPGEVCIAICPNNYCRNNGHCRVGSDDNFYCSCAEWYVGERCEIPGLAIIGAVAAIAVVLLVVLTVILVYTIYKRSRPHRRLPHQFRGVSGKRRSVQWNQKTLWPGIIPTDDEHVIPARYQSIARSPLVFEDSLTLPV
ncbi:uncharacterized protein LOC143227459 [Tachypleus tridentatus]|uniref:uncharacterized protein LOC143227459 n=1 Tax=Tachypleus tridentatus TaxID=6853 RepID=UPI003FD3BD1C